MRLICSALLCGLTVAGCASVSTADGRRLELTSDEFRAYVERVFREQNRVGDELAFALEAAGAERPALAEAEQRLLESCASVNELATARRDEVSLGLRRNLRAARSVPQCEAATREATEALARRP